MRLILNYHYMKTKTNLIIALLFFAAQTTFAQIEGYWKGQIDLGMQKLGMAFDIKAVEDGFSASLDVPAQGAFDIPVDEISFQEGQLQLKMKAMGASYSGTLKDTAIEGDFTQHGLSAQPGQGREGRAATNPSARPTAALRLSH